MQKGKRQFLPELPGEQRVWPGDPADIRVTRRALSNQTDDLGAPGTGRRKTLVLIDIVCLLVASIPFFVCEISRVQPTHRGFYCNDSSIRYPLKRVETVSDTVLISVGILISALSIALGETYRVRYRHLSSRSFVGNSYVAVLYKEVGAFLFGCTVGQSLTSIAKLTVGRLRPHFLAVCQPDPAQLDCSRGYVLDYVCTGRPSEVREARKSFYSGHASFAMYSMLYLVFYLQARFTWHGARLLRPLVQFILILMALYTGLTRVSDYRHHPSDVAAGLLQGALVAYWVAFHISSMFRSKKRSALFSSSCPESPDSNGHTNC
ncbi:phospholipid phosphatase 3 isoform X1 [Ornithorhynchus anatinus]|uniref:Phosphatidic acid phosphatase type 2/haloperoxidase domain-containing protein n=1 Tax=Ornithorhynchus anatinus TaxID=9258 RepID=A0A6I8NHW8_ORNAN|nr:phospholipid phosphatase 3 isoform X1 [Ornithorhynchus anatinus]XP_028907893.1 phospholipid phosphatase 3 isoform X1 [Ornithorhynchus anatinus]